jgi:hypothetical protein
MLPSVDLETPEVSGRTSKAQVGAGLRRSGPHLRIVAEAIVRVRGAVMTKAVASGISRWRVLDA